MHARLAFSLFLVGACAAPAELSTVEQGNRSCPEVTCGVNSPNINYNGFHELAKDGTENDEGFAITGFAQAGLSYRLEVTNGELSGSRRASPRLEHAGLVGAEIQLVRGGRESYRIRVASVGRMPFAVRPAGWIETYVLEYIGAEGGEWKNVCGGRWVPPDEESTGPQGDLHLRGNPETYGQLELEAILFDQDRFDMESKKLNSRADSGWFNIGCAGHTLSKMYLTRNTLASQDAMSGQWAERQATLKMLTADYCGDGTAFTVAGQRLDWQGGGVTYYSPPLALEARWTDQGAACLDTPRMARPSTPEGAAAFRDIEGMIALHCPRPPRCADSDPMTTSGGYRISALR
jgi:ADYC domain